MSDNYINHAEKYLGFWKSVDSRACEIFASPRCERSDESEKDMSRILQAHDISRKRRFEPLFDVLDAVENLDGFSSPVEAVAHVREELACDSKILSFAASNILWFKFKSPIVICDRRSMDAFDLPRNRRNYEHFYPEWRERFAKEEAAISKACDELAKAHPKHKDTISEPWFRERVFDTRLLG